MQSKYYITEVSSEEEVGQVTSIWESNLPVAHGDGIKKYQWFYQTTPYQKARLWLLKLRGSEKAVGVGGVGYRRFSIGDRSFVGAIGVDLAVEKGHRTLGPALKLQRTIMESAKMDADFLYGFPFNNADVILKHYGYQKIAEFTRLVKVLRSGNYLKSVVKPSFLSSAVSIPADLLLRVRSVKTLWASGNVFESDSLKDSYPLLDRLWNRIVQQGILIGERSSEYVAWRYFKCPEIKYRVFGIKDNDNSLQGVIVYFLQNKKVEIADLICADYEDSTIIHSLFTNFEKYCFTNGADLIGINLIGCKGLSSCLLSMGFWRNKKRQTSVLYINTGENQDLLDKFKDLDHSYWLWGDLQ